MLSVLCSWFLLRQHCPELGRSERSRPPSLSGNRDDHPSGISAREVVTLKEKLNERGESTTFPKTGTTASQPIPLLFLPRRALDIHVLEAQRDIRAEVESGPLAAQQLRITRSRDHRRVVGRVNRRGNEGGNVQFPGKLPDSLTQFAVAGHASGKDQDARRVIFGGLAQAADERAHDGILKAGAQINNLPRWVVHIRDCGDVIL